MLINVILSQCIAAIPSLDKRKLAPNDWTIFHRIAFATTLWREKCHRNWPFLEQKAKVTNTQPCYLSHIGIFSPSLYQSPFHFERKANLQVRIMLMLMVTMATMANLITMAN